MNSFDQATFVCPAPLQLKRIHRKPTGGFSSHFFSSSAGFRCRQSVRRQKRAVFQHGNGNLVIMASKHPQPMGRREIAEGTGRDIYFATCARGLGEVLAREIQAEQVNGKVISVASSGVRFSASEPHHVTGYRACIWLRTAMRVLLEVSQENLEPEETMGTVSSRDMSEAVYDFVKSSADWSLLLGAGSKSFSIQVRVSHDTSKTRQQFPRRTHARGRFDREVAVSYNGLPIGEHTVQVRAKDAICDALRDAGLQKPPKPTSHAESEVPLFITVHGSSITLYLDMAGASLHKRGYRSDASLHKSSLNESVAAGMLYMAGFQPDGSFVSTKEKKSIFNGPRGPLTIVDPMCGSGTLLIEAALLRLRVAVGLYRRNFAFQTWMDYDKTAFLQLMDEAVSIQRNDDAVEANFIGNDINPSALSLARRDLERTRLTNIISLHHADARELALPAAPTLTISNPPWGLRLGGEITAWEHMGRFLRDYAGGCTAVFLSGDPGVTRGLRMKARKRLPVRIGNVDTRVLIYDVLPKLEDNEKRIKPTDKTDEKQQNRRIPSSQRLPEHEMPIL